MLWQLYTEWIVHEINPAMFKDSFYYLIQDLQMAILFSLSIKYYYLLSIWH